jgi:hypothetical protein
MYRKNPRPHGIPAFDLPPYCAYKFRSLVLASLSHVFQTSIPCTCRQKIAQPVLEEVSRLDIDFGNELLKLTQELAMC